MSGREDREDDGTLWAPVLRALRDCIDAHGPLTAEYLTSATKRVVAEHIALALLSWRHELRPFVAEGCRGTES